MNGLTGAASITAYNGQTPLFNLVAPDNEHREQLQIFGARFGARGVIPGTGEKINYFVLTEFGNNGLTRENSRPQRKVHRRAVFARLVERRVMCLVAALPLRW